MLKGLFQQMVTFESAANYLAVFLVIYIIVPFWEQVVFKTILLGNRITAVFLHRTVSI